MSQAKEFSTIEALWMSLFKPESGRTYSSTDQLYAALPAVYRERDEEDDLLKYLAGFGAVLDEIRGNLDQCLRDTSPFTCQAWLLPYFADLLDVRPLSPDIEGQRQEIAKAVHWRQRKGTVAVCIEIAEAVGQAPIIAFEGHNSVATTSRVGYRQPTMDELGESKWQDSTATPKTPSLIASRPGTPAVTVDFSKLSAPYRVDDKQPTPLSVVSRFGEEEVTWQHENAPHGVPGHLGGYEDVSMRTVDMRSPNWSHGHHHPKRLRLYTPVPEGFIKAEQNLRIKEDTLVLLMRLMDPPDAEKWVENKTNVEYLYQSRKDKNIVRPENGPVNWEYVCIEERLIPESADKAARENNNSRDLIIRRTLLTERLPASDEERQITTVPEKWETEWDQNDYLLQWERYFDQKACAWHTSIRGGTWDLANGKPGTAGTPCPGREHLKKEARWPTVLGVIALDRPEANVTHFIEVKQVVFAKKLSLEGEHCTLSKVAALELALAVEADLVISDAPSNSKPPHPNNNESKLANLKATDCLIQNFDSSDLVVEIEYCTVNIDCKCAELRASDCILLGTFQDVERLRLRYCCVPQLIGGGKAGQHVIKDLPSFHSQCDNSNGTLKLDKDHFGKRGYGVLHQCNPASIRHGAEDGGELGAFHHRHYCGRQDAVVAKLIDFLPVGMQPVLIVDPHWQAPLAIETMVVHKAVIEKKDPQKIALELNQSLEIVNRYKKDFKRIKAWYNKNPNIDYVSRITGISKFFVRNCVEVLQKRNP